MQAHKITAARYGGSVPAETSRRASRRSHAQDQFRPTPIASDFEVRFADQFYTYAETGGAPSIDRFPTVLRRERLSRWLTSALVVTTLVAIPVYFTIAPLDPPVHWTQDAIAAWLTSALVLAGPFSIGVLASQRRFTRLLHEMNEDRAAYVAHIRAQEAADAETEQRLRHLGIAI